MRRNGIPGMALVLGVSGLLLFSLPVSAAEHGGKEHGGKEHGGMAMKAEPSAEAIRQAIRDYIASAEQAQGAFTLADEAAGTTRTLELVRVHERVGKTGDLYYACTDMQDTASGELLDLDFDVEAGHGHLRVADVRIHKVEGEARYTYDEDDNRIPLQ